MKSSQKSLRFAAMAFLGAMALAGAANAAGNFGVTIAVPGVVVGAQPAPPLYYPRPMPLRVPAYVQPPTDAYGNVAPVFEPPLYSNMPPVRVLPVPQVEVYPQAYPPVVYPSGYPAQIYPIPVPRHYYNDERRFDDNAPWDRRDQAQQYYERQERRDRIEEQRDRSRDGTPGHRR